MAKASYGDMGRKKTDGAVFKGGYLSGEDATTGKRLTRIGIASRYLQVGGWVGG